MKRVCSTQLNMRCCVRLVYYGRKAPRVLHTTLENETRKICFVGHLRVCEWILCDPRVHKSKCINTYVRSSWKVSPHQTTRHSLISLNFLIVPVDVSIALCFLYCEFGVASLSLSTSSFRVIKTNLIWICSIHQNHFANCPKIDTQKNTHENCNAHCDKSIFISSE